MADLVLRPSGIPDRPWSLQLRYHDCCGPTEYLTLTRVSEERAREIVHAGAPFWLFGDPDEKQGQRPTTECWIGPNARTNHAETRPDDNRTKEGIDG